MNKYRYWLVGIGCFLSSFSFASLANPISPYERLLKVLPVYEQVAKHPWPIYSFKALLAIGSEDEQVEQIRERLCLTQDLDLSGCNDSTYYDQQLANATALFQERHGLKADGIVGPSTLRALNVSLQIRLEQIQLNLARWKKFIAIQERTYIWINVPDYRLRLVVDSRPILTLPVIVGKVDFKTPELNSKINRIIINPYWYVPSGMLKRLILPNLEKDPNYLASQKIKVFSVAQPGKQLDPRRLDLEHVYQYPLHYIFRQDFGPNNSLGQIKFEFANRYMVYLHDTSNPELFEQKRRLFSSGCIRLKDPFIFLDYLAQIDPNLNAKQDEIEYALNEMKQRSITLKNPLPIHVTYITSWVDEKGLLHFWDDVYSRDQPVKLPVDKTLPAPN